VKVLAWGKCKRLLFKLESPIPLPTISRRNAGATDLGIALRRLWFGDLGIPGIQGESKRGPALGLGSWSISIRFLWYLHYELQFYLGWGYRHTVLNLIDTLSGAYLYPVLQM